MSAFENIQARIAELMAPAIVEAEATVERVLAQPPVTELEHSTIGRNILALALPRAMAGPLGGHETGQRFTDGRITTLGAIL